MIRRKILQASTALGRNLCKFRGRRFVDHLEINTDEFHRQLNNVNFNMVHNGELRVLKILANTQPNCIFDVGANKGDWCRLVARLCPTCKIHAFEIVPATYEELVRSTKGLQNVNPNNFGFSSEDGVITVSLGPETGTATGCKIDGMQFHEQYYSREIKCEVLKASDYIKEKTIGTIDFVKVDVEGMDLKVIKGFEDKIKNVRVVQFEYGIFNIGSHDLLSDFYRHLKNEGFIVGKIFPRYVNFAEYHFNMENFHGSNYLAVRKEEKELIRNLSKYNK